MILVQLLFDFMFIEVLPERLIGDHAYDSDKLDDELRQRGVEMIAPTAATVGNLRMVARCNATSGDGRSSGSSAGCTTTSGW